MGTFLEDIVLPELIKADEKDKLESEIISLRKKLNENFKESRVFQTPNSPMHSSDFKTISDFIKKNSGYLEYFKDRETLPFQYESKLKSKNDELKVFFQEPTLSIFENANGTANGSFYNGDIEKGIFEIHLEETPKYEMVGVYGHEYTHHTQMCSALDVIGRISNFEENKLPLDILTALREGQALKMEEDISKLYFGKENNPEYLRYISSNILNSMIRIYDALDFKNKSKTINLSPVLDNICRELLSGEIGITYFKLNNLESKDYYKEIINRFVK